MPKLDEIPMGSDPAPFFANLFSEAVVQRCFEEKVFWNYAANLQENTYAKVQFQ